MIDIKVSKKSGDVDIKIKGHANYSKGDDIVCSAVSAITQTALLGLEEVSKAYPDYVKYEEK